MRSLILFDLHYQNNNPLSGRKADNIAEIDGKFDAVILGGDNAELSSGLRNHRNLFKKLKERFECPLGFILGNHELWGRLADISSYKLMNEVFPELGQEYGFTYLEHENLNIGDISFVGTYGHFDYSFLRQNRGVSMEDLLRGTFVTGEKKITWKDRIYMDWDGKSDEDVCAELIGKFDGRVKSAAGKIVSFSHTIPRLTLNGWPNSPEQYFMEAYSGSNRLGDLLQINGGRYHFCGHTHAKAKDRIGETEVINLGSDYNSLRYAVLNTSLGESSVEEVEVL